MSQNRKFFYIAFVLIIFYLLVSMPILQAGFFGDDVLNSTIRGTIEQSHTSLLAFCIDSSKAWLLGNGRIFPLGFFLQYPSFYILYKSAVLYQTARLVFIGLSLITTAWLLKLTIKNIKVSFLFLFLVPALWSIRDISDPLTSYSIFLSALTIFIMFSLCCFVKFNENKKVFWLSLSLLAYACALLTYELGVITFFCVLIIAWFNRITRKNFFLAILPHAIISALYLTACFIARHYAIGSYDGTTLGYFNKNALLTFIYQLTASLPLNYGIFSGHCFKLAVFASFFQSPFSIIHIIILFCISFFALNKLLLSLILDRTQRLFLLSLGLTLNIIPALLIASTIKYQNILAWGLGYLPVYIQYIGTAFIFLSFLSQKKRNFRIIFSLLFSIITCLTLIFNTAVVKKENLIWQDGRDLEISAIQHGLFNNLPPEAIIISKDQWATPAFYQQYGGIRNTSIILIDSSQLAHVALKPPLFFMKYDQEPYAKDGQVLFGQITDLSFQSINGSSQLTGLTIANPTIFSKQGNETSLTHSTHNQPMQVTWLCFRKIEPPTSFHMANHVNICKVP